MDDPKPASEVINSLAHDLSDCIEALERIEHSMGKKRASETEVENIRHRVSQIKGMVLLLGEQLDDALMVYSVSLDPNVQ